MAKKVTKKNNSKWVAKKYGFKSGLEENISNQNTLPKVNTIVWPSIKYAGKVNKRGLFMIGTSKVIVQPKEIYQDIKFISIAPDSSIVEYKGEKKVFKKQ